MPAPDAILKLCETFAGHRDHFRSGNYNEAQLRQEFLDPFFKCLGWDMDNAQGLAPQYRDVIHEDALKIGIHTKAPDYAFTIHGQRKFFLEAKKPSVNIKGDVAPAYQLRRYAWSAKLPLSVLSDFEEFAIYDTRVKPAPGDASAKARTFYCTFDQYPEKWDDIAAIFSRDAILKGSFDKYADSSGKKKGTAEVDAAFLAEIERWRDLLARNFALRNPALSARDLNFAVQKTIDRLVFLRICEDRGSEDDGRLRTGANGNQCYPRLLEVFQKADDRYNSGLFHFSREKDQAEEPDTITPALKLDDKAVKDIIGHLYYPDSPYEFSVLPADILGSVYERFLGKTIRLTDGHQAKIEEKPEVRKAGGVYYTPAYIVDYIVRNTLGRLLNGPDAANPQPITLAAAAKLKVADIACGSGSFLIQAYQFLLDWHRDRYLADPEKWSKGKLATLYPGRGGEWRLTSAEKKRILLANIHGVDIDASAVEVTKLSLLLKVLEGETDQIKQRDFLAERQRILPDLARNIRCGNSLIGPDFYDHAQPDMLDDDARFRVNVFDWQSAFPEVFQQGGFDCIVGNPPYVRIQAMKEWAPQEVEHYRKIYKSAAKGNFDIYVCFIEKGSSLLNAEGTVGMILPSKFLTTDYGLTIRALLTDNHQLAGVVDFGHSMVFAEASTYTCLLFFQGSFTDSVTVKSADANSDSLNAAGYRIHPAKAFTSAPWILQSDDGEQVRAKLKSKGIPLLDLPADMNRGSSTGSDDVFLQDSANLGQDETGFAIPIFATDFGRYAFHPSQKARLIFPYDKASGKPIAEGDFKEWAPIAYSLLTKEKPKLQARKQFQNWYLFSAPRSIKKISNADFLVPLLAEKGRFALLPEDWKSKICLMASGGFGISLAPGLRMSRFYILGLLNSTLLFWELRNNSNVFRGGWITCTKQYVGQLPIRPIDFALPADVAMHDRMVGLVERMLEMVPKRRAEKNPQVAAQMDAQIAATDRQIDRLVYELYGLTEEEINLVEGKRATIEP